MVVSFKIFENTVGTFIGLWFSLESGSSFLKTGETVAVFSNSGYVPV